MGAEGLGVRGRRNSSTPASTKLAVPDTKEFSGSRAKGSIDTL